MHNLKNFSKSKKILSKTQVNRSQILKKSSSFNCISFKNDQNWKKGNRESIILFKPQSFTNNHLKSLSISKLSAPSQKTTLLSLFKPSLKISSIVQQNPSLKKSSMIDKSNFKVSPIIRLNPLKYKKDLNHYSLRCISGWKKVGQTKVDTKKKGSELIRKLALEKKYDEAISFYNNLKTPSSDESASILHLYVSVSNEKKALEILQYAKKKHPPNIKHYHSILILYINNLKKSNLALGYFEEMKQKFSSLPGPTLALLLRAARNCGSKDIVKEIWEKYFSNNTTISDETYSQLILSSDIFEAEEIENFIKECFLEMKKRDIKPSSKCYNNAIVSLLKNDKIDSALYYAEQIKSNGLDFLIEGINSFLAYYSKNEKYGKVQEWASESKRLKIPPTLRTYTILLKSYMKMENYELVMKTYSTIKAKFKPDSYVFSVLIEYLDKNRKGSDAIKVYQEMKDLNIKPQPRSLKTLIRIFANEKNPIQSQRALTDLKLLGVPLTFGDYFHVFKVLMKTKEFERAKQILQEMIRKNFNENSDFSSTLKIYNKSLEEISENENDLKKELESWNQMEDWNLILSKQV